MNYLSGRQQYVHIDNVHSGFKKVLHGIPQGSILGPRLFITYINDMCNASSFLSISYFQMIQLSFELATILNY